ncbi:hypothetical protein EVAR_20843_1 [Eumeta japonica]|uniref:Uncharacterized protein n=1 Tax=Eumeta variegata TaxID=151549 RepID=A0A4C1UDV2_EUMVA|nr:hypothetical protein EVAR_20843_1 [Eumeta japonica]
MRGAAAGGGGAAVFARDVAFENRERDAKVAPCECFERTMLQMQHIHQRLELMAANSGGANLHEFEGSALSFKKVYMHSVYVINAPQLERVIGQQRGELLMVSPGQLVVQARQGITCGVRQPEARIARIATTCRIGGVRCGETCEIKHIYNSNKRKKEVTPRDMERGPSSARARPAAPQIALSIKGIEYAEQLLGRCPECDIL